MSTQIILQQMAVIAVLVLIGGILYKRGVIDEHSSRNISALVVDICNPAVVIACVLGGDIQASHREVLIGLGISGLLYALLCILGAGIPRLIGIEKAKRRFYNVMLVYSNIGFLGIPLARAMLSGTALLYVILMNVLYYLVFYTHGIAVMRGGKNRFPGKKLISPGTIAPILALLIFWFDIRLPAVAVSCINYAGNATTFLSLALLGASLAKVDVKRVFCRGKVWLFIGIKMLGIPLILGIFMKALGLSLEMREAFCLMLAVPAANLPLIQAEKDGMDTTILSNGIMATTLVSLATITVVMNLLF